MTNMLFAKSESQSDITKLLCDILSVYTSYLMDNMTHNYTLNCLHLKDTPTLPFDVDVVFEHMCHLKDDMIDERNK